ncbi:LysR family transcriptional regulator [Pararobbsia alpina]
MHELLRRIDLNLMLVFDALMRHRSVAAAADELSLSSSACSHALSRMRSAMGDPLFVRHGSEMQPTAKAEQMAEGVRAALESLTTSLGEIGPFEPSTSHQTFTFAATDFTAFAALPYVVAKLEHSAPHIRFQVDYSTQRESIDDLNAGRVQFALGFSDEFEARQTALESFECAPDDYVVAARKGHPRIKKALSLKQYLFERHVVVIPWRGEHSVVNKALANVGVTRDVAIQLPSLMAAPFIVAESDMLITLPRRVATRLSGVIPLSVYPVPFEIAPYVLRVAFHKRNLDSPTHKWMRERLQAALNALPSA